MNLRTATFLLLGALAVAACDKPSTEAKTGDPASKNAATGEPATTTAATAAAPPTIADGDLSTPADFEETAEKAITKANYKAELSTLEADVAKE